MKKEILAVVLAVSIVLVSGCNKSSQGKESGETEKSSRTTVAEREEDVRDDYEEEEYDDYEEDDSNTRSIPSITKLPDVDEFVRVSYAVGYDSEDLFVDYNGVLGPKNKRGYPNEYSLNTNHSGEFFHGSVERVETDIYDEIPSGNVYYEDNGDNGYILFDVSTSADSSGDFFGGSGHDWQYYGGIFYYGSTYMEVYVIRKDESIKNSEKDKVDEILTAFGLPTPR